MSRFKTWLSTGFWTVLDQGLFAGSNFVLNVLLARWLVPEEYGAFTVAYTVFLFFGTIHGGFVTEPMLVYGPGRYRDRLPDYLRLLVRGQAGFALLSGAALAVAGGFVFAFGSVALGRTLLVLGAAQYGILFLWLMRQACYVRTQPRWAASGGMVYAALVLGGAGFFYYRGHLSATAALALMSGASLVAGAWLFRRQRIPLRAAPDADLPRAARADHLGYGRWAASTGALEWVPGYLSFLLLPLWAGLEASAALKALLNFILPAAHAYGAICMMLVPVFVRARVAGTFNRMLALGLVGIAGATGLYWLALGLGGAPLMDVLYGGLYTEHAGLLWLVGSIPFMAGLAALLRTGLRAQEQPDRVFWAYLGSALVAATAGAYLIYRFGITGALCSFLVQMTVEIGVMAFFLFYRPAHRTAVAPGAARAYP